MSVSSDTSGTGRRLVEVDAGLPHADPSQSPDAATAPFDVFKRISAGPLALTKLVAPLHQGRRAHPQLLQRLRTHRGHCLVQAPAGYGKTSLAAAFLADLPRQVRRGWISLDADDSTQARLRLALAAAFASAHPPCIDRFERLLVPEGTATLGEVVTAIINEAAVARFDIVLVLDDCHAIEEVGLLRVLSQMMLRAPSNLRLVLLSRSRLAMPLASLQVKGEVLVLGVQDLALTRTECIDHVTRARCSLRAEAAASLVEASDGWPLAVHRLCELLQGGAFDVAVNGADVQVWDETLDAYLFEQVIDPLPQPLRRFLVRTSLLSSFDGAACREMTMDADGATLLDDALQRQLFIVPHEQRRTHYRYCRFFRACLRRMAQRECATEMVALHRIAARHCLSHDELAMAMDHAVAAGDKPLMVECVERVDDKSGYGALWESLGRVISSLDDDTICSNRALLVHACRYWLSKDCAKVVTLLERTGYRSSERMADIEVPGRPFDAIVALFRAKVAFGREERIDEGIACAEYALMALPEADLQGRCEAHLLLAEAKALRGNVEVSLSHWIDAEELSLKAGSCSQVVWSRHQQAVLAMSAGNFAKAVALQDSAILHAARHGGLTGHAMWCLCRARADAAWEYFDLVDVARFAEQALNAYRYCEDEGGVPVLILHARTSLLLGRPTDAESHLAQASRLVRAYAQHSYVTSYLDLAFAECHLRLGKTSLLAQHEERLQFPTRFDNEIAHRQGRTIALCRLATGRVQGAAALLERMNDDGSEGLDAEKWRNRIWMAVCLQKLGRSVEARSVWQQCLAFAERRHLLGSLLMAAPCAEPLLRPDVAKSQAESRLNRRLRELIKGARGDPQVHETAVPAALVARGLTIRDWRVFEQVLAGSSNEDISNQLHLAVGTVKNMVTAIFRKLDVTDREAARRLGHALLGSLPLQQ